MRLISFEADGKPIPAVLDSTGTKAVPLNRFPSLSHCSSLVQFIQTRTERQIQELNAYACGTLSHAEELWLRELRLTAPIPRPIHDILCIGVNYQAHREECAQAMPLHTAAEAVYFSKRACHILGPAEAIPAHGALDEALDYEVELAVVLGRSGRDIPLQDAPSYIFGYSVFNDISARGLQQRHGQWFRGKSLDGFSVMGPCIVTGEELSFPLQLESRVNGELRQRAWTDQMIRGVPQLICALSQGMTLEAGDILITGTPAGVGMGFTPPRYLKAGDQVECCIRGVGKINNQIMG